VSFALDKFCLAFLTASIAGFICAYSFLTTNLITKHSTQSTVQRSNINAGAAGIRLTANDKQLGKQSGNQANKQAVRQTNKQSVNQPSKQQPNQPSTRQHHPNRG
jgi:hypothetical protein